jgi:hypothetical protein
MMLNKYKMRLYEFNITESYKPTGIKVDDGEFFISKHFLDMIAKRGMTGREISNMIHRAIDLHKDKILAMGTDDFVIKTKQGPGVAIGKVLQPNDTFKYLLITAHPDLRVGLYQDRIVI